MSKKSQQRQREREMNKMGNRTETSTDNMDDFVKKMVYLQTYLGEVMSDYISDTGIIPLNGFYEFLLRKFKEEQGFMNDKITDVMKDVIKVTVGGLLVCNPEYEVRKVTLNPLSERKGDFHDVMECDFEDQNTQMGIIDRNHSVVKEFREFHMKG